MNAHLLESPEWLDESLIKEEWDEMRLALVRNGAVEAVLVMGIDPPKRKQPAKCLLWLRTHSGQTTHWNHLENGGAPTASKIRPPKSVFLSRLAAEHIQPRGENAWHEAEYQLVLPDTEDTSILQ